MTERIAERIVGKVARVTSDRELIINRGSEQGVETGTVFRVRGEEVAITDPDTKEALGTVNRIKVVVRVEEVGDKFSIARTFRSRRVQVGGGVGLGSLGAGPLSQLLQPPKFETRVETLRIDRSQGEPMGYDESVVKVGDVVESVLEGEDIDPATTTLFR